MQANNINGQLVEIRTKINNQFLMSDLNPSAAIATNGYHQAILVGNIIFDNMNPNGVDYNSWYNSLHAPNGFNETKTPF